MASQSVILGVSNRAMIVGLVHRLPHKQPSILERRRPVLPRHLRLYELSYSVVALQPAQAVIAIILGLGHVLHQVRTYVIHMVDGHHADKSMAPKRLEFLLAYVRQIADHVVMHRTALLKLHDCNGAKLWPAPPQTFSERLPRSIGLLDIL